MLTLSTKTLAFSTLAIGEKGDSDCITEISLSEIRKLSSYPGKTVLSLFCRAERISALQQTPEGHWMMGRITSRTISRECAVGLTLISCNKYKHNLILQGNSVKMIFRGLG